MAPRISSHPASTVSGSQAPGGLAAAFAGVDQRGQFIPVDENWRQERAKWNHDIQSGKLPAQDPEDLVVSHYFVLQEQAFALVKGEGDWVANAANLASLLFNNLDDVNYVGFYRLENASARAWRTDTDGTAGTVRAGVHDDIAGKGEERGELVLGPFMGKPACVRIPVGTGVCGVTAAKGSATLVPDVHAFAGHIACDSASRSEVVVPVFDKNARLWGVLDCDSPTRARFTQSDVTWLSRLADVLFHHE